MTADFFRWMFHPAPSIERAPYDFKTYLKSFGMIIALSIVLVLYNEVFGNLLARLSKEIDQSTVDIGKHNWLLTLCVGGMLAPISEELAFRLPLKLSFRNLAIAVISAGVMMAALTQGAMQGVSALFVITCLAIAGVAVGVMVAIRRYFPIAVSTVNAAANTHYFGFVYGLSLLFAVGHRGLKLDLVWLLISVLCTLPRILDGLFFSFLRMRYGLISSILCHMTLNMTAISISLSLT